MNIAIDITPLENEHQKRGMGVYTKNLLTALQKYEKKFTYKLFTRAQKLPDNIDAVHYPYFDPFFLTLPLVKPQPTIVTVHDLAPIKFPDKFPPGMMGSMKWQIQKLSLLGAKTIITDSESSKEDIAVITRIPRTRIEVVYLAADPVFRKLPATAKVRPYFLYVGDVNWNKNIPTLLRAFASVKGYDLVLVGGAFTNNALAETKKINTEIRSLGLDDSVRKTGYVDDRKLNELYCGAAALVIPSYYEGFGLPALEAMQSGCPVILSDVSSLHEIAGPAIKVKPDENALAEGMKTIMNMRTERRAELIHDQLEWAKSYSWRKVARETAAIYEKVVNHHTRI